MSIYVCGDTHGDLDIGLLSFSNWPESRKLTEKDVVVILGDFGLIWGHPGTRRAKKTNTGQIGWGNAHIQLHLLTVIMKTLI